MVINDKHKIDISAKLRYHKKVKGLSLSELDRLIGINKTAISWIVSDAEHWKEQSISDSVWKACAKYLKYTFHDYGWSLNLDTVNIKVIYNLCRDAKGELGDGMPKSCIISGLYGRGKSAALKYFLEKNPANTYYMECQPDWVHQVFISKIKMAIGAGAKRDTGLGGEQPSEAIDNIINTLKRRANNVMLIDEFQELPEPSKRLIKTLQNRLDGQCGFVLCGGENLKRQFNTGTKLAKQSIQEIYSRCGAEIKFARDNDEMEIAAIIRQNGVDEERAIRSIINDCNGDLRRVKRAVHHHRLKIKQAEKKSQLSISDQNGKPEEQGKEEVVI